MTTGLQCFKTIITGAGEGRCCLGQDHSGDCKTWDQVQAGEGRDPSTDIQQWADSAMYAAEPMQGQEEGEEARPRVYLVQATADPLGSLAAASMMYEGKVAYDLTKITDEQRRHYFAESFKTHLKAPWEYIDFHFMVEGVTRAFTHQMVRQRTAVYAQESLRFAVKEGFAGTVPLPPSLLGVSPDEASVMVWKDAIAEVERAYETLVNMGVPAEDARGLLPHSIPTRLHYKTNFRNLAEHVGNRLCTQAQFEWRVEITELVKAIAEHQPINRLTNDWQFKLIAESDVFKPVCFSIGKCPFTADFDRGCTIRPRVEEGKFDEIKTEEWLMDPAAARRGV